MADWADEQAEKLFLRILGRTLYDSHKDIAECLRAAYARGLAARPTIDDRIGWMKGHMDGLEQGWEMSISTARQFGAHDVAERIEMILNAYRRGRAQAIGESQKHSTPENRH